MAKGRLKKKLKSIGSKIGGAVKGAISTVKAKIQAPRTAVSKAPVTTVKGITTQQGVPTGKPAGGIVQKAAAAVGQAAKAVGGAAKGFAQGVAARAKAPITTVKGIQTQQGVPTGGGQQVAQGIRQFAQGVKQRFQQAPVSPGSQLSKPFQSISPNLPNYSPAPNMSVAPNQSFDRSSDITKTNQQLEKQISAPIAEQKTITDSSVADATDFSVQDQPAPQIDQIDPALLETAQTLANQGLPPDQIAETINQQTGSEFGAVDIQGFLEGGQLAGAIPTESYLVQPGDNLNNIARRLGVAVSDISGYRSGNANLIYPGENLTISRGGAMKKNVSPASAPVESTLPGETSLTSNETDYKTYLEEKTYGDIYKDLVGQLGLDAVRDNINDINDKLQKLQDDRAEEEADINNNPWISESLRAKKIQSLGGKYDQKEANLREAIKNSQDVYDDARQEAQFAAKMYIDQQNEARNFYYKAKQDTQDYALQIAKFKYDQQLDTQKFAYQKQRDAQDYALSLAKFNADQAQSSAGSVINAKEFVKNPTAKQASARQGIVNALEDYKNKLSKYKEGFLTVAEKAELENAVKTTIGSAINVAQGQGAMGVEEGERILNDLLPSRWTRTKVFNSRIKGIQDAQKSLLNSDLSFLENEYPTVRSLPMFQTQSNLSTDEEVYEFID